MFWSNLRINVRCRRLRETILYPVQSLLSPPWVWWLGAARPSVGHRLVWPSRYSHIADPPAERRVWLMVCCQGSSRPNRNTEHTSMHFLSRYEPFLPRCCWICLDRIEALEYLNSVWFVYFLPIYSLDKVFQTIIKLNLSTKLLDVGWAASSVLPQSTCIDTTTESTGQDLNIRLWNRLAIIGFFDIWGDVSYFLKSNFAFYAVAKEVNCW